MDMDLNYLAPGPIDVTSLHHCIDGLKDRYQIFYSDADFGRTARYKSLGLHHQILYPDSRLSLPHAERDEDEFVLVLSGNPVVWIDGEVYSLNAGDAVVFPSGTGVCHTFINKSEEECELLVFGEKGRPGHQFIYPFHGDLRENCVEKWWDEWPKRSFGSHKGSIEEEVVMSTKDRSEIIRQSLEQVRSFSQEESGHYTFPLLSKIGVELTYIPVGHKSPLCLNSGEEELFLYVIEGELDFVCNGATVKVKAKEAVPFIRGEMASYTLQNVSSAGALVISCIGKKN